MNHKDNEKILELKKNNHELEKLYSEHQKLEEQLRTLSSKKFLTAVDEQEERRIKSKKLFNRDRMNELVRQHEAA